LELRLNDTPPHEPHLQVVVPVQYREYGNGLLTLSSSGQGERGHDVLQKQPWKEIQIA